MTADLRKRLAERGIALELTEPRASAIAREGFDPVYGARPLKRYLQRELETRIGRALIAGEASEGTTIEVGAGEGGLRVEIRKAEPAAVG